MKTHIIWFPGAAYTLCGRWVGNIRFKTEREDEATCKSCLGQVAHSPFNTTTTPAQAAGEREGAP